MRRVCDGCWVTLCVVVEGSRLDKAQSVLLQVIEDTLQGES